MDAARDVRRSALDVLAEIEPRDLAAELQDVIAHASMVPGVVTVLTAEAMGGPGAASRARERAIGVQLSYEGLRLTRQLIRDDERYAVDDPTDSYLALVAGEVMVARGFSELAETAVAGEAIEIVQRFSRNQTVDYDASVAGARDGRSLEHDVVALAVGAGATAVLDAVPPDVSAHAERLATELDREPLPPASEVSDRIRSGVHTAVSGEDPIPMND